MTQSGRNPHEPWLRGTLTDIPAVPRAALHALEQAKEDIERWTRELTDDELNQFSHGIPSIAFHIRHIARSLDRLLTYAEGKPLSGDQIALLKTELTEVGNREGLFGEFHDSFGTQCSKSSPAGGTGLQREPASREQATTHDIGWSAGSHCRPHAEACRSGNYYSQDHRSPSNSVITCR